LRIAQTLHVPMINRSAVLAAAMVLIVACRHGDDTADSTSVHVGMSRADTTPLRDGDVRIEAQDGGVDLALIGDTVSSGLSQSALAKAKHETDTASVKGGGLGSSIERMVKSSVQSALGTRVSFPLADVKGARYENGRIEFDWNGKSSGIFTNTKVNKKPLLESFRAADAQRFVDAVNARKGALAR
jgi:hypothetical protein